MIPFPQGKCLEKGAREPVLQAYPLVIHFSDGSSAESRKPSRRSITAPSLSSTADRRLDTSRPTASSIAATAPLPPPSPPVPTPGTAASPAAAERGMGPVDTLVGMAEKEGLGAAAAAVGATASDSLREVWGRLPCNDEKCRCACGAAAGGRAKDAGSDFLESSSLWPRLSCCSSVQRSPTPSAAPCSCVGLAQKTVKHERNGRAHVSATEVYYLLCVCTQRDCRA